MLWFFSGKFLDFLDFETIILKNVYFCYVNEGKETFNFSIKTLELV